MRTTLPKAICLFWEYPANGAPYLRACLRPEDAVKALEEKKLVGLYQLKEPVVVHACVVVKKGRK